MGIFADNIVILYTCKKITYEKSKTTPEHSARMATKREDKSKF